MKAEIRKHAARTLAVVLAVMTFMGYAPQLNYMSYADDGDPDIVMGAEIVAKNVNTDSAQKLWYGGRDWCVIACDGKDADGNMITYENPAGGTENLYQEGVITLFQRDVYENSQFSDHGGDNWDVPGFQGYGANGNGEPSILRKSIESIYLNGDDTTPAVFSPGEVSAITSRILPGYGYQWSSYTAPGAYDKNRINMNDLEGALVWPISHAEADAMSGNIKAGEHKDYWLRSSGKVSSLNISVKYGAIVGSNGNVYQSCYTSENHGVRPAFNLNKSAVLFTSSAYGGKVSGKAGAAALKKIGVNSENEWKVTVKDTSHQNFTIDSAPSDLPCSEALTLQYSGAVTGTNQFISAIICDADGNAEYYGRVKKCSSDSDASGEVTVNLKNKYSEGDKLYLFNEQANGDELTDYASDLKEISVPGIKHPLYKTEAKDPKCEEPGNSEYWSCMICGKFFGDENAEKEIERDSCVIPASGHKWVQTTSFPSTFEYNGYTNYWCSVCDKITNTIIFRPDSFELDPASPAFTGSQVKPNVIVKDVNGDIIDPSNYDVKYSNNVNIGTASVNIAFNGKYFEGSKDLTFNIIKGVNTLKVKPKAAKIKSKKLKKKTQKLAVGKYIRFADKGKGDLNYKLVSAKKGKKNYKKYFKIHKTSGKLTVKKGLKKGTYKIKVNVRALGNNNYNQSEWKKLTISIKVK